MKKAERPIYTVLAILLVVGNPPLAHAQSNTPPEVFITWPAGHCQHTPGFSRGTCLKIKAFAHDLDGSVTQVNFFVGSALIGVVTNAPFEIFWFANPHGDFTLKAVAYDNLDAVSESYPLRVIVRQFFPSPAVFEINSPANGTVFQAPGTFVFTAEQLASPNCENGPVEFFVGTNSVGVVTQPGSFFTTIPFYSINATNVPEGEYRLSVQKGFWSTFSFAPSSCDDVFIRVTKLGLHLPKLTPDGRFSFDVVTSFPTNQNVIEASSNLLNWAPISANVPFTNTFSFTDPSPATSSPRFYRVVVPSQ